MKLTRLALCALLASFPCVGWFGIPLVQAEPRLSAMRVESAPDDYYGREKTFQAPPVPLKFEDLDLPAPPPSYRSDRKKNVTARDLDDNDLLRDDFTQLNPPSSDDASFVEPGDAEPCPATCCSESSNWTLFGWLNGGATANFDNPPSRFNGPVLFDDRSEGQFNQAYAVLEKRLLGCELDFGGRIDVLYGSDYVFVEAAGLERHDDATPHWNGGPAYGLALPQFYAEVGNAGASLKAGHFYSVLGYETAPAANNFFYSHSYVFGYGEPKTLTGLLATVHYDNGLTLLGGAVNGWDKFDATHDHASIVAGVAYTPCDANYSLRWSAIGGHEDNDNPMVCGNRTAYSFVFTYQPACNLEWVVQHDCAWQENGVDVGVDAEWYGVNQYLFWTFDDCWKFGARLEWFRDDDGVRVHGLRAGNVANAPSAEGNFYEVTLGANWTPHANLSVRPEIRYDWFDGTTTPAAVAPFDDGTKNSQWTAAIDAILWF